MLVFTRPLCRVEEATLLARQKEAEAASVAGKLPSTLPAQVEAKALAKVNGECDAAGGSGSTSVIQCVWPNVLRLATAVPGGGGGAGGSMAAPPPVSTAAVMEAAATRRKALELVEVREAGAPAYLLLDGNTAHQHPPDCAAL